LLEQHVNILTNQSSDGFHKLKTIQHRSIMSFEWSAADKAKEHDWLMNNINSECGG
jgi:hypothetical protein